MSLHQSTLLFVVTTEDKTNLGVFLSKQSAVFFARKTLVDSGEHEALIVQEFLLDHPCRSLTEAAAVTSYRFEVNQ